jgi:peptidoglycan/xylan/chitin deacetylase (PgdA/CDA1 family)
VPELLAVPDLLAAPRPAEELAGPTLPDRHRHRRTRTPRRRRGLRALIAVLALVPVVAFGRLTVAQIHHGPVQVMPQVLSGADPSPANLIARLQGLAAGIPHNAPVIITYHQISETDTSEYSVSPRVFATQMSLLHSAGWHTITNADFIDWINGGDLPAHSVLVTFDDGARGVWRYADPVLRQYGMHATAFIITGWVGTHVPYYMTWPELQRMQADGHWDLQAHTNLGHTRVAADAKGNVKPFLATQAWLPGQRRVETIAEYTRRVSADLQACIAAFRAHGLPRPWLFAYPFSARGEDRVGTELSAIVHGQFAATFLDSAAGTATTQREYAKREFRRVDVLGGTNLSQFVDHIADSSQAPVSTLRPTTWTKAGWTSTENERLTLPAASGAPEGVALSPTTAHDPYGKIELDPTHSSFWTNYRVDATVARLGPGTSGGVEALLGSDQQVEVVVTRDHWSLRRGYDNSTETSAGALAAAGHHDVSLTVHAGAVVVQIDGQTVAHLTLTRDSPATGGVALTGKPGPGQPAPLLTALSVTPQ